MQKNNTEHEAKYLNKKNYEPVTNPELLNQIGERTMLETADLRKTFGDFTAVDGVNLRMFSG